MPVVVSFSPDMSDGEITIYSEGGEEVYKWIESEWIEEPSVVLAIINAIHRDLTGRDVAVE